MELRLLTRQRIHPRRPRGAGQDLEVLLDEEEGDEHRQQEDEGGVAQAQPQLGQVLDERHAGLVDLYVIGVRGFGGFGLVQHRIFSGNAGGGQSVASACGR